MLRFKLGSIPVEIHFSHVLVSMLLAYGSADSTSGDGWPAQALRDDPAMTSALVTLMWMAIITFSVLVHELGHALVSLAFGYKPSIHLIALGGTTYPNANETIPWHKDVLLTLAGPLFGAALGVASLVGWQLLTHGGDPLTPVSYLLRGMAIANLIWAVMNLIPVPPLDGGRIASAVLMRILGRPGFLVAQLLAVALGVGAVAFGLAQRMFILVALFGMYVARAVSLIGAYRRGEAPALGANHPFELAMAQAEAHLTERQYAKAKDLGQALLEQDLQPPMRSRVHHLLGWVALKEGQGKLALEHFAHVQGQRVSPAALAGAFSLVGDDEKALPLWATAASSGDLTVRHEWAGTLLRLGREAEIRQIPEVKPALAWAAAQRIHFLRKEYGKAGAAAESSFQADPRADVAYDAACSYALGRDAEAALRMLQLASQNGFARADVASSDGDLAFLHGHPGFEAWLGSLQKVPRA